MTDLEMIKKCAEKMGIDAKFCETPIYSKRGKYNPLHDDAQAMALVKKFVLSCRREQWSEGWTWVVYSSHAKFSRNKDLNRAIVECVAKLDN
jgi:hypothetical protein